MHCHHPATIHGDVFDHLPPTMYTQALASNFGSGALMSILNQTVEELQMDHNIKFKGGNKGGKGGQHSTATAQQGGDAMQAEAGPMQAEGSPHEASHVQGSAAAAIQGVRGSAGKGGVPAGAGVAGGAQAKDALLDSLSAWGL